jgi:hypothetical protein
VVTDPECRAACEAAAWRIRRIDELVRAIDARRVELSWTKAELARRAGMNSNGKGQGSGPRGARHRAGPGLYSFWVHLRFHHPFRPVELLALVPSAWRAPSSPAPCSRCSCTTATSRKPRVTTENSARHSCRHRRTHRGARRPPWFSEGDRRVRPGPRPACRSGVPPHGRGHVGPPAAALPCGTVGHLRRCALVAQEPILRCFRAWRSARVS